MAILDPFGCQENSRLDHPPVNSLVQDVHRSYRIPMSGVITRSAMVGSSRHLVKMATTRAGLRSVRLATFLHGNPVPTQFIGQVGEKQTKLHDSNFLISPASSLLSLVPVDVVQVFGMEDAYPLLPTETHDLVGRMVQDVFRDPIGLTRNPVHGPFEFLPTTHPLP